MNTSTFARSINRHWLRRGIIAAGALLIASGAALGLAHRPSMDLTPASMPSTRMSSAPAVQARYEDFKLRQIDQHDAGRVRHATAAQTGYEDFKLRQVDQMEMDGQNAKSTAPLSAQLHYEAFKLRQIEEIDTLSVNGTSASPSAAQTRWENFKLRQIDQ